MSIITLIRHGETTWNAARRVQGQLESPLSERGIRQAEALAASMRGQPLGALYASDLSRAHHTALKIAEAAGAAVQIDARLRERHYGVFQGLTWDEIKLKFPDEFAVYKSQFPGVTIPGGESVDDFSARVLAVLEWIAGRHAHAVVVAHGGLVDMLYRHASAIPIGAPRDYPLPNASVNRFSYDGRWHVEIFGDIAHLAEVDLEASP
jgi:probable phosphoglycerate mutase